MDFYHLKYQSNISIACIWISGGSDKDSDHKKGINQILSSLVSRGCKDFDNFKLSNYLDSYGADLNCETLEDGILINIKSTKFYFKKVYPILNLIIEDPILSKEQFKICKQNIINHIKKSKENPFNVAFENWRKLVYKNHSYAFDPNGYVENINCISYGDIIDEYNNFKKREKVLLSNYFYQGMNDINSFVPQKSFDKDLIYEEKLFNKHGGKCKIHYQNTNQLIILLGNRTCSCKSNDFINLKILESYLAYGMSSKLFRVFRENNGLAYDVGVFNPLRKSTAPFVVYLSSSQNNSIDAFNHLVELWEQITSNILFKEELDLAKIKLNASIAISSQTTEEIVNRKVQLIGLNLNPKFDDEYSEKISKVKAKEILFTAQKYLRKPVLSISGNKKYCNQIRDIWQNKF